MLAAPAPLPSKFPPHSAQQAAYDLGITRSNSADGLSPLPATAPLAVRLAYIQGRVDAQMQAKGV
jgi:hypothetical protein